jgi:hypothetical protein
MDPLSIIASVVGVSTTATQLSSALYSISNRVLNAPKEISQLAMELALISQVTRQLGVSLEGSKKLFKADLFDVTKQIIEHFQTVQNEIHSIILNVNESGKSRRLNWLFTHSAVKKMLLKMQSLQQLVLLAVSTIQVAIEHQKQDR